MRLVASNDLCAYVLGDELIKSAERPEKKMEFQQIQISEQDRAHLEQRKGYLDTVEVADSSSAGPTMREKGFRKSTISNGPITKPDVA